MTAADTLRQIWISGALDIRNYGDALFPLLAGHRLERHGYRIRPTTPFGGDCGWMGVAPCTPLGRLFDPDVRVDGLLIGGGNIVYGNVSAGALLRLPPAAQHVPVFDWAAPGIWLGPMLVAALRDVPVAWNAPGVPYVLTRRWHQLLAAAFRASDPVSLRDEASVELLGPAAEGAEIAVPPDTAIDLAAMWPRAMLAPAFARLLARKSAPPGSRFWAIHLRDRSLGETPASALAGWIDAMAHMHGLVPVLVAIGPTLGDADAARDLAALLTVPCVLLDDPEGPVEIAAAIAHAEGYTGASLHGYVTAAAYGLPGVLVARPAHRKFGGFLAQIGQSDDLRRSWAAVIAQPLPFEGSAGSCRIPQAAFDRLDQHWAAVRQALDHPERRQAERADFLRAFLAAGFGAGRDPGGLLAPFCTRPDPAPQDAPR